jgi:hypothetical protein
MKQARIITGKITLQIKRTKFEETFELITSTLVCGIHGKIKWY